MRLFALAMTMFVATVAVSHAQEGLPAYLEDTADAAVRVEIVGIPEATTQPQTIWQKLRALISTRSSVQYRPEVGTMFTVNSSAYASSPYQTDSTPCITAVGTRVRPGVVASNFLPIGTLLDINGLTYIVEDRMNARYKGYFLDLWFPSTSEALEFGRKKLEITVTGYTTPGSDVRAKEVDPIPVLEANELTFWQSIKGSFTELTSYIGAKVGPDVNRYDVDCLGEEQAAT